MSDPIYAKAGDVFFTRSGSLLGRLIRWAETDPGEEATWTNHTGVVVRDGWIVPPAGSAEEDLAIVVESLWHTEKWAWWKAHSKETGNEIRVYRRAQGLHPRSVELIVARAERFVGAKYGWWKLLVHLADRAAFKGTKVLSNFLRVDKRPICSYTAAQAFAAGGVLFGMLPEAATPDEMLDHCERSGEWVLVGSSRIEGGK